MSGAALLGALLAVSAGATGAATPAGAPHVSFALPQGALNQPAGGVGAAIRWNVLARELAAGGKGESFQAFSILSAAQYRASSVRVPSNDAAIVAASAAVLTRLFPAAGSRIATWRSADLAALRKGFVFITTEPPQWAARNAAEQFDLSTRQGAAIGEAILQEPTSKAATAHSISAPPPSTFIWTPEKGSQPEGFQRQFLVPWFPVAIESASPAKPPAQGTQEFTGGLEAVWTAVTVRTREQTATLKYWAGQEKGETVPGLWNGIADQIFIRHQLAEGDVPRGFALVNAAMHDAEIACFRAKYRFWLSRPTQLDHKLVTPIRVPNDPSYPSADACLSGAASEILGALFPEEKTAVTALANEAAQSQVQAGLHFPFDADAGLDLGRRIADVVLLVPGRMLQP